MKTFNITKHSLRSGGFSLIEVVLAIGIFLVTILALVGLLGPTLKSVDEVEKTEEVVSVVNSVNAFLQNSPEIAPNDSKFNVIYNAVKGESYATLFVFREYRAATGTDMQLKVGFSEGETLDGGGSIGREAVVTDFSNSAGPIYRVVLTPSSVIPTPVGEPDKYRSEERAPSTGTYSLNASLDDYEEGYFAMEVRIYAEEGGPLFDPARIPPEYDEAYSLAGIRDIEPIFTYNTAIVR